MDIYDDLEFKKIISIFCLEPSKLLEGSKLLNPSKRERKVHGDSEVL